MSHSPDLPQSGDLDAPTATGAGEASGDTPGTRATGTTGAFGAVGATGATGATGAIDASSGAGASALLDALAGRLDRWRWSPGLTPEVVGQALGVHLAPGPARLQGRDLMQTAVTVPGQPYPVRLRWEVDGELALAELSAPVATPSWPDVLAALGDPTVVLDPGPGPFPGSAQRCHLDRGLTIFDGAGLGYQAVWLYPPMPQAEYGTRTGAFEPVRRTRR